MKCPALLFALVSLAASPAEAETYTTGSIEVSNPWMRATPRGADVASRLRPDVARILGVNAADLADFNLEQLAQRVSDEQPRQHPRTSGEHRHSRSRPFACVPSTG